MSVLRGESSKLGRTRRIARSDAAFDVEPAWSPDGSKLAFRTFRDGNSEIYVMNADGTGLINLTNHAAFDLDPAWSPAR